METVKYDNGMKLVFKYIRQVFPEVSRELAAWTGLCKNSECQVLAKQALDSLSTKRFHAQGGSVFALYPQADMRRTIRFIVSLQTISDYLDNLCDRAGVDEESAFRQLHLSMLDAVDPARPISDYYGHYPYKEDNGYLQALVEACREQVQELPAYPLVLGKMKKYVQLYTDLQTYKHLSRDTREEYLGTWADYYIRQFPGLTCWEFSAAAGSTLAMFIMFVSAFDASLTEERVRILDDAYFPWICGLHILLDYYIDAKEDRLTGDLNFTEYYRNLKHCEERLAFFVERAVESCSTLEYPLFHLTVVKGLLAMYLSDPKAFFGLNRLASRNLLKKSPPQTGLYWNICRMLRHAGVL